MEKKRILIIDDDQVMSKSTAKRLEKRGYTVEIVHCGAEGLTKVLDANYDLVLLDIKMPGMDGVEVLKRIRDEWDKFHLPVIMFSSCDEDEDVVNALSIGANDYVTKPVNINVLLSRISTHLEVKKLSAEHAKAEQLKTISALVVTYNHEINNVLATSLGQLSIVKQKKLLPEETFKKLEASQLKIRNIISKISEATKDEKLILTEYGKSSKMVKIS